MTFYYGCAAIVTAGLWLMYELKEKSRKGPRISLGLATVVLATLTFQSYTSIEPAYERMFTAKCFNTIQSLIQKGVSKQIPDVLSAYQRDSQRKSHYVALSELREKLEAIDNATSNQAARPDR